MQEQISEKGIVLSVKDGIAELNIIDEGACSSCGAKMFCKPGDDDKKLLTAKDTLGVKPGDIVLVSLKGDVLVKAAIVLYGLPLILVVLGILVGMEIFKDNKSAELYSFLIGVGSIAVYFGIFFLYGKSFKMDKAMPNIVHKCE